MSTTNETINDRIERVRIEFKVTQLAVILAFVAAVGFLLLFVQEPLVHDSIHNFRHAAGITCH